MATITEDYVSFEVAKLLKEKGFDGEIHAWHNIFDKTNLDFRIGESPDCNIPAPTLQMTMKWLREVHNVHVSIMYNDRYSYPYEFHVIKQHYASKSDMNRYATYEECVEKAINFCLENLI